MTSKSVFFNIQSASLEPSNPATPVIKTFIFLPQPYP